MSDRLYTRIAINFIMLLAAAMVAVTLWFYITVGRPVARDVHTMLRSHNGFIGSMVETCIKSNAPEEDFLNFFQLVSGRLGVETALLNAAGEPILASDALAKKRLELPERWVADVRQKGLFVQSSHSGKPVVYVTPLHGPGNDPLYLYSARHFSTHKHHVAFLAGLLVIGAVLAGAVYPLSKSITRPLSDLTRGLEKMSAGDFNAVPAYARKDEIGTLFRVFREMSLSVDAMIRSSKQLLADISHELCSPLTRIRLGTELLHKHVSGDRAANYLKGIETEIVSMDRLVANMAAYSGMNLPGFTPSMGRISPWRLVAGVHERYLPVAEVQNIHLAADGDRELPEIEGDRELLTQVFVNLLDNAFRHTPAGGTITIGAENAGDRVRFFVSDTGPGVPEADRERIFEPLYRVDPSRNSETGGAGLGLAIARKIVTLHMGDIDCARENGITRFGFRIKKQKG
ncbi:histidine kinase [Desulfosudis oleivorans Hxd3]|uniref:histidine kinase n=2 Tax=Desulfosudis TaxID=2904716 RepID=A8ZYB7_DESOH|nr:HAMP domain-containing sensor histidine kinase [Desulfosudis oleivorans]ABW67124.1 histidine kinase [Desulfosudis oleivorans Hxd3]